MKSRDPGRPVAAIVVGAVLGLVTFAAMTAVGVLTLFVHYLEAGGSLGGYGDTAHAADGYMEPDMTSWWVAFALAGLLFGWLSYRGARVVMVAISKRRHPGER